MATRLSTATFGYQNFFSATLSADITSGTTVIGLSTVPTPTAGILVIEPDSTTNREVVLYTSKGASTVTAPSDGRGYSGSTAVAHLQGSSVIMAPVDKWFTALASGELSSDPLRTELFFDYVASGLVWTADAAGSTKNASMTSGVIYILGKRLTLAAVTARVFTASKDTYIDVSDNGDGTGLITYNEVTNNATSPALSTNNVRIGIIITGATNIANAGSVNQGQESAVLPIASSVAYTFTDSLGNIINPRDPLRRVIGYRQTTTNTSTADGTGTVALPGLTVPVIIPAGRKVNVIVQDSYMYNSTSGSGGGLNVYDSTSSAATGADGGGNSARANGEFYARAEAVYTPPASGARTFLVRYKILASGTVNTNAGAAQPVWVRIELV